MWRALLFFALALGVVLGGLFLLRRTANTPTPKLPRDPQPRNEDQDRDKDEDENGW
ncbi:MAG TPA: DUF2897 family protein [Steroidobacteraceae bacterium]|nr:DUF2897 family protein [Steroidobacteraceae bacterium]